MTKTKIDLCTEHRDLGKQILDFITHVGELKEESITDYLAWQWRKLDHRFKHLSADICTRQQESTTTGADLLVDLELWIVGRKNTLSLAFQAKKFLDEYGGYVSKLRYPKGTMQQLNLLKSYAANNSHPSKTIHPYYLIYTPAITAGICPGTPVRDAAGIYMVHANKVSAFASPTKSKRLALSTILKDSKPFHCLFCCPISVIGALRDDLPAGHDGQVLNSSEQLPGYVQRLLASEGDLQLDAWPDELSQVRSVGVLDLRLADDDPFFNGR